jgi:hypothetical protein
MGRPEEDHPDQITARVQGGVDVFHADGRTEALLRQATLVDAVVDPRASEQIAAQQIDRRAYPAT